MLRFSNTRQKRLAKSCLDYDQRWAACYWIGSCELGFPMTRLFGSAALTASALILIGGSAVAADLPAVEPIQEAAVPEPTWSGPYMGLHAGWGWADSTVIDDGLDEFSGDRFSHEPDGFIGGALAGYNWQTGSFVFGVEGDISLSGVFSRDFQGTSDDGIETTISSIATLRGRVGLAFNNVLAFLTAGGAIAHVTQFAGDTDGDSDGWDRSDALFNTGSWESGYVLGGGAEIMLNQGWSAGLEYLFIDLGRYSSVAPNDSGDTGRFENELHTVRARLTKSLYGYDDSNGATAAANGHWMGPYMGVHAGWGWVNADMIDTGLCEFSPGCGNFGHDVDGFAGGAIAGYDWRTGNFVFGVEGDVTIADFSGRDFEGTSDDGIETTIDGIATMRGRVGYAFNNVLAFLTAGGAIAHVTQFAGDTDGGSNGWDRSDALFNTGSWESGYVLGGGAEIALGQGWSGGADYQFIDLGSYSADAPNDSSDTGKFENEIHTVRLRLTKSLN